MELLDSKFHEKIEIKEKGKILKEKNPDKEKLDILHKLNYLSFSDKEKESKLGNKPEQKSKEENPNLSLQKFFE